MASTTWANMSESPPTSPQAPPALSSEKSSPVAAAATPTTGTGKKKLVRVWEKRPATMVDLRKAWKPFGLALDPGNEEGLTVREKQPVFLELGSVDPLEKQCRDEVATVIFNSHNARVEVPLLKHIAKLRVQYEGDNAQAAPEAATSPTSSSPAVPLPTKTEDGEKLTWAAARKTAREREEAAKAEAAANKPRGPQPPADKCVIRVSNLVDSISNFEIQRLFGPQNGLGKIQRLYIAKDSAGNRKGFCYITYSSASQADAAIQKMHRCAFRNVILYVDYGTPQGGSGGGGGQRGPPRM